MLSSLGDNVVPHCNVYIRQYNDLQSNTQHYVYVTAPHRKRLGFTEELGTCSRYIGKKTNNAARLDFSFLIFSELFCISFCFCSSQTCMPNSWLQVIQLSTAFVLGVRIDVVFSWFLGVKQFCCSWQQHITQRKHRMGY